MQVNMNGPYDNLSLGTKGSSFTKMKSYKHGQEALKCFPSLRPTNSSSSFVYLGILRGRVVRLTGTAASILPAQTCLGTL